MPTLYDCSDSGNAYKVRLLLAHLGRAYRRVEVDIFNGASRAPEFLAKNPFGRVPTLVLDDGTALAESNAILWFLGEGSAYVPTEPIARARVLQWMFWEQYDHEPYVATPRYILRHLPADSPRRAELPARTERGHAALALMNAQLSRSAFLVGESYSIADICLYAYTHVAEQAGIALAPYPALTAWLERVRAQPRHVPITA